MNSPSEETRDDLIIVARAVRTRGLKGELLADVLTDFPERFEQVSRLTGVSTSGERKHFELENHWFQNDRMVLKFAGYDSIESAASDTTIAITIPTINNATSNIKMRNTASPVFPVGESTRRQCEACPTVTALILKLRSRLSQSRSVRRN